MDCSCYINRGSQLRPMKFDARNESVSGRRVLPSETDSNRSTTRTCHPPVYELAERYATRVAVLSRGHRLDDGQRLQLLSDHVRLEVERLVGQRGPHAPDEVDAVLVFRRVGHRPEYFHAAGPVHRRRGAHATRLRILSARFRVVLLRHT